MATDGPAGRNVAIIGQGYVGLQVAVRAAEVGFTVVGFDVSEDRVKLLSAGESFVEDVPAERLAAVLASDRYRPTSDPAACADFDVAVISVPTPLREGNPDLSHIEHAATNLGSHLRAGACVILESTTYPGTTEELVRPTLERGSGLVAEDDFFLGYSPERIDPGNADSPPVLALGAQVRAADPHVAERGVDPRVVRVSLSAAEVAAADAVVVLVDHQDFDLDLVAHHARYVLDTRDCMTGSNVERL